MLERSAVEDITTDAFVLRTVAYGESDRVVIMLSDQYGKLAGMAKGARRSKRRFAGGALEPFQRLRVRFGRRAHSSMVFLHDARVEQSYNVVGTADLAGFAWGSYLSELVDLMTPERDPCPELFDLYEQAVAAVARGEEAARVGHHFMLLLLDHGGWKPDFSVCGICAEGIVEASRAVLDPRGSGVVCSRHEAERLGLGPDDPSFKPSRRVIETRLLDYVGHASRGVPDSSVTTDPELVATATAMLDRLVELHLPRQPRSRALRDSLVG